MANALAIQGPGRDTTPAARTALVVSVLALAGLSWALAQGLSPLVVLVVAALPLVVALGYRYSLPILVAVLVVRPLVDGAGLFAVTAGLGAAVIAIGALCALHDVRAALLLACTGVPLGVATSIGLEPWGSDSWTEGLRLLSIVAVAAVALVTPTALTRTGAARVVQVAGIVPAAVAIYQALAGTGTSIGAVLRSPGTLSQANPAAHFFSICAVATLVLVVEGRTRRRDLAMLAFFALAMVTTGSIGGFGTFVVSLLVYLGVVRGVFSSATLATAGGLLLLLVAVVLSPLGQGRIAEFFVAPGPTTPDNSVTWRFNAWGKIIDAWRESPVLGRGLGATVEGGILETNIGHNEYLYVLTEMGLIGAVLVLGAVLTYVGCLIRFHKQGASRLNLALALGLLAGTALNSTIDNPLHFSPSMFVVAFLLATVWRISSRERAAARARLRPAGSVLPVAAAHRADRGVLRAG